MRGKTRSNKFEKAADSAIYVQIADKIRLQLTSGALKEGEKLSSIREISDAYDVNYLTARQALKHLESLGLVEMQTGRGTYVTSRRSQQVRIGVVVPDLAYRGEFRHQPGHPRGDDPAQRHAGFHGFL